MARTAVLECTLTAFCHASLTAADHAAAVKVTVTSTLAAPAAVVILPQSMPLREKVAGATATAATAAAVQAAAETATAESALHLVSAPPR